MVRRDEVESSEEFAIEELDSGNEESDLDNVDLGGEESNLGLRHGGTRT